MSTSYYTLTRDVPHAVTTFIVRTHDTSGLPVEIVTEHTNSANSNLHRTVNKHTLERAREVWKVMVRDMKYRHTRTEMTP